MSDAECIVELHGGGSQGGEGYVELRACSREWKILRKLGVLHLENPVTRPRYNKDESEASILKEAGVHYLNSDEYEEKALQERAMVKMEASKKLMTKPLRRAEVEILREAGVSWLEDMAVVHEDDMYSPKLMKCDSIPTCSTTEAGTIEESIVNTTKDGTVGECTVNSTYAERELMRRLKSGWSTVGEECGECGMPVICKSRRDLLECVICGVVGAEDDYDPDLQDCYNPDAEDVGGYDGVDDEAGGPGVFDVGNSVDNISAMGFEPSEIFGMQPNHCQKYHKSRGEDHEPCANYSGSCAERLFDHMNREDPICYEDDEAYKEELGLRLFDGWELTGLNCPHCNMALMSEGGGASAVCLRCG